LSEGIHLANNKFLFYLMPDVDYCYSALLVSLICVWLSTGD